MDEILKQLNPENGINELDSEWLPQLVKHWRVLSEAERKAMVQLDEIRSKLISKETELSLLQADINMLAVDRDNKIVEMEGLTIQLKRLRDENELSLKRIQNFETELDDLRQKNTQLTEELIKKAEQLRCLEGSSKNEKTTTDLHARVKELDGKMKDLQSERDKLAKERSTLESEREEEIKGLQEALDEALQEKIRKQNKFDHDFRELQSANSGLMDDFEWKLRQIEATCKKKIQDKESQIEEKMKEAKLTAEKDFLEEKEKFNQEKEALEKQMKQINHWKSYEAEVVQLRGLTHEQQKALRAAARQLEQFKFNEKLMQDELHAVRNLLDKEKSHLQIVQSSNQRRMDQQEEKFQAKLDKQKNELNSNWEDKMRSECARLKQDLCRLHAEEKHLALESMKLQKDQEFSSAKQMWEGQKKDLTEEISRLKDAITEKESYCHRQMEKATTIADRESCELRRKLEKISNTHLEQLDELKMSHSEEMDVLRKMYENTVNKLKEVEKRLVEYEQIEKNDDDSLLVTACDALSFNSAKSPAEKEESESESEEEEESEASESEAEESTDEEVGTCNGIDDLREEVANLQGSIEKLTSSLAEEVPELLLDNPSKIIKDEEPSNDPRNSASPISVSEEETSSKRQSSSRKSSSTPSSDLSVPPFFLISVVPFLSYLLFQSILVVLWTFLVIIAFRLCRTESTK